MQHDRKQRRRKKFNDGITILEARYACPVFKLDGAAFVEQGDESVVGWVVSWLFAQSGLDVRGHDLRS